MLKQLLVCSLSALLLAGCSTEEAVPKKVIKPMEPPLEFKLDTSKNPSDPDKTEVHVRLTLSPIWAVGKFTEFSTQPNIVQISYPE